MPKMCKVFRFNMLILLVFMAALVPPGCSDEETPGSLPDLAQLSFSAQETKLIKGEKSTEDGGSIPGCKGVISPTDTLGELALVSMFKVSSCYLSPDYTHGDYTVSRGKLVSSHGGVDLPAYKISEPARKATKELWSPHGIYYKFPTKEDYTVYEFADQQLKKVDVITARQITVGTFIPVSNLTASSITGSKIYVFAKGTKLSFDRFARLGDGVTGARVARSGVGDVLKIRFKVEGTLFDTVKDYAAGPSSASNRYGQNRKYFVVSDQNGREGVVWQDQKTGQLWVSWLAADRRSLSSAKLSGGAADKVLAAATADASGNIFALVIEIGDGSPDDTRKLSLHKFDAAGKELAEVDLNGAKSGGLNIVSFSSSLKSNRFPATMTVSGDKVGLMLGRKMHKSSDGLNHQGGIGVVFDASSLSTLKNLGQTSGHSFGNVLTVNKDGEFLGIDLGDNYPRGINLHKFTEASRLSRVVYTFKTRHGSSAQNPAGKTFPKFDAASAGGKTYYQWSNDNDTYTELGGVVQTDKGYLVFFTGEQPSLDNTKVGASLNAPRNIGVVLAREDFENASKPKGTTSCSTNIVPDDLVLSEGAEEKGGFYTFSGKWCDQRNKGIVWLTTYTTTDDNATRLKAVPLPSGKVLLLWEVWDTKAYKQTYAMEVDGSGKAVGAPQKLGPYVRLGRRDEPLVSKDGTVLVPAGNTADGLFELVIIEAM